jgi:hypothetical protein
MCPQNGGNTMNCTESDIRKALKCCANKKRCHECPFCSTSKEPCYITLAREAASLLSRRDAEIERLKKELIEQQLKNNLLYETAKEIRTEAIKEFAEMLKNSMVIKLDRKFYFPIIDNLVKEMTEEIK